MKKRKLGLLIPFSLLVAQVPLAMASNPIIKHLYTADPSAIVSNDTLYVYTGHDEAAAGENRFVMRDWRVFSSKDLVNWTDHGAALSLNDFSWASADAWAGEVVERNGKFYWYVPVNNDLDGWFGIGVAVGDSPTGPFTDALGHALINDSMTPDETLDIDPTVFVDYDGQAYMYWGNATDNGVVKVVKLKDSMIELDGPIMTIGTDQLPNFTEAPYLHERNGIYYLSYAAGWPERIEYATADNPLGPFTHRGVILDAVNSQTSHQSILEYRNQWYFVYHTADLPGGGEFRRSVAMEPLYYDDANQGAIYKITPTITGVGEDGLSGRYSIVNRNSGKCLRTLGDASQNATDIVQFTCDGSPGEQWQVDPLGTNRYNLTHVASNKSADIFGGSMDPGAHNIIWPAHGGDNQQWIIEPESDDFYHIRNVRSQLMLDISGRSKANNANNIQWPDNGGLNQDWAFTRPGTVQLESVNFPGFYVSYLAEGIRIDQTPDPFNSSFFKVVQGLAHPDSVSFESVMFPGYYLRHKAFVLYLELDDGSDTFHQDASFFRKTGLGDATGVSYESVNFPGQFIRHSSYYLKIDSIVSETDKLDATFHEQAK
ncbi:MAG: family 43 glycosylhydrolase [Reinekea sp.]|nr:family 43 glycosylhydrolase [Reinekea sp.]